MPLVSGATVHSPAYPEPCSYVRVLDASGREIAYWTIDELREDPADVLGALMGAMSGTTPGCTGNSATAD